MLLVVTVLVTTACTGKSTVQPPTPEARTDLATQPASTATPAPTATVSVEVRPTAIAAPTMLPATEPAVSTPSATPKSASDHFPKDERGRIIGGPYAPIINYSPTMIMGKPCPRVTHWTFKVVSPPGLQPYGIADDPCVVQNAIDDYVRTRFALPAFNTPKSMKEIAPLYETDPALLNGLSDASGMRKGLLHAYQQGNAVYNVCDKPTYFLLDEDARAPMPAQNDGKTVDGKRIQITLLRVAKDVVAFSCRLVSYRDGSVQGTFALTVEDMQTKGSMASVNDLVWNGRTRHWELIAFRSVLVQDYRERAAALWNAMLGNP
jgi:hypothetical protein